MQANRLRVALTFSVTRCIVWPLHYASGAWVMRAQRTDGASRVDQQAAPLADAV